MKNKHIFKSDADFLEFAYVCFPRRISNDVDIVLSYAKQNGYIGNEKREINPSIIEHLKFTNFLHESIDNSKLKKEITK